MPAMTADPDCFTLLCEATVGMMTWFDVFMFMLGAAIVGGWVGIRIGRWYERDVAFDVRREFERNLARISRQSK